MIVSLIAEYHEDTGRISLLAPAANVATLIALNMEGCMFCAIKHVIKVEHEACETASASRETVCETLGQDVND